MLLLFLIKGQCGTGTKGKNQVQGLVSAPLNFAEVVGAFILTWVCGGNCRAQSDTSNPNRVLWGKWRPKEGHMKLLYENCIRNISPFVVLIVIIITVTSSYI